MSKIINFQSKKSLRLNKMYVFNIKFELKKILYQRNLIENVTKYFHTTKIYKIEI